MTWPKGYTENTVFAYSPLDATYRLSYFNSGTSEWESSEYYDVNTNWTPGISQYADLMSRTGSNLNQQRIKARYLEVVPKRTLTKRTVKRFKWVRIYDPLKEKMVRRKEWYTIDIWKLSPKITLGKDPFKFKKIPDLEPNSLLFYERKYHRVPSGHLIKTRSTLPGYVPVVKMEWTGNLGIGGSGVTSLTALTDVPYYPLEPDDILNHFIDVPIVPGSAPTHEGCIDPDGFQSFHQKVREKVVTKVLAQHVHMANVLVEANKTIALISSSAVLLGQSFLQIWRGNLIAGLKALIPKGTKEGASMFLAYRYGVEPLMKDVAGAAQHLAEWVANDRPFHVRAKESFEVPTAVYTLNKADIYPEILESEDDYVLPDYSVTIRQDVDIKYHLTFGISDEFKNTLGRLGFTNPASVAWELTPFSFVIDWFAPIGNWLMRFSAFDGLVVKKIERTTVIRTHVTAICLTDVIPELDHTDEAGNLNTVATGSTLDLSYEFSDTCIQRELLSVYEFSSNPFPRLKNPVSVGHVANALALLRQIF